jgi:hypothetical protein
MIEEEKTSSFKEDISIYDESVSFIAPMFIIHSKNYRSLSVKLSLESFIASTRDTSMLLLSMVNRSNNKGILIKLANDLILNKRLSLIGVSKFFNKLNQIYK